MNEETLSADGTKMLTGLIGRGIGASQSPLLHEREGTALGLRLTYSVFDFDKLGWADDALGDLITTLARKGFSGVNVTYPFKQAVVPLLDTLSPEAEAIGAVNSVVFRNGKTTGHNTDVTGFAHGIRTHVPPGRLDHVLQLGGGGAGSATAHALLALGVGSLTIVEPDEARLDRLIEGLRRRFGRERITGAHSAESYASTASGIVNATPIGMAKLPGIPLDPALLSERHWIYDIIYFPAETALLTAAKARGCLTINGINMVVYQAAEAFELFTGVGANPERMYQMLEER